MNTSANREPLAKMVSFGEHTFNVELEDGRILCVPYSWYPRLIGASKAQLENYRLIAGGEGISWEALDEDISIDGLIQGKADGTNFARKFWQAHPEHRPNFVRDSAA
ncbi:MAG: DUF2442 domain-containing protein [Chlorobiales bacterium]|jgi:hypothetical protein|nr:DUF2442 domain-containing protein [Chlorobiales bacterium]